MAWKCFCYTQRIQAGLINNHMIIQITLAPCRFSIFFLAEFFLFFRVDNNGILVEHAYSFPLLGGVRTYFHSLICLPLVIFTNFTSQTYQLLITFYGKLLHHRRIGQAHVHKMFIPPKLNNVTWK